MTKIGNITCRTIYLTFFREEKVKEIEELRKEIHTIKEKQKLTFGEANEEESKGDPVLFSEKQEDLAVRFHYNFNRELMNLRDN